MSPVPVSPRRVFGVDFSAARDAGRHIWICRAHPGADGIRVEGIDRLDELPGGETERDGALRALVQKVLESPRSAWGFDFSFALPQPVVAELVAEGATYSEQLEWLATLEGADELRRLCGAVGSGELRRRTDGEAATPFSPYNLRIYKQTFHGMVGVLRPLRTRPEIAVLPLDRLPETAAEGIAGGGRLPFNRSASGKAPHIYVMEVCPSSVLAALGYPRVGYKGEGDDEARVRKRILERLVSDELVRPMRRELRTRILDDTAADALDALLAAVGAWRGYRSYDHAALGADPLFGIEGFVYT
jgi:hypothetical protein